MDAKVLVLGLDGATPELLERWVEEGDDSPGRYATGLLRKLAPPEPSVRGQGCLMRHCGLCPTQCHTRNYASVR